MLSRTAISLLLDRGLIEVTPPPQKIGPNSIDLRLGDSLKTYHPTLNRIPVLAPDGSLHFAIDPRNPPPLEDVPKMRRVLVDPTAQPAVQYDETNTEEYWLLVPGQFYLGVTLEETYCRGVVPHLDGRSTCGRLSIEAHKTAGVGDNGFRGRWTLEIEATEPVLIRPGDRLFQVYFTPCWGGRVAEQIIASANGDGLFDLLTLYESGEGHHYQESQDVQGPAPLT